MSIVIADSMITINGASISTTTAVKLLLCSPLYISCITTANAATTANGIDDYFGLGLEKFLLVTVIPGAVICIIIFGSIIYCVCCGKKTKPTDDKGVEMNRVLTVPENPVNVGLLENVSISPQRQKKSVSYVEFSDKDDTSTYRDDDETSFEEEDEEDVEEDESSAFEEDTSYDYEEDENSN